ncbi:MAG: hypothetical protein KDB07_03125 [Planctomycetes bacterium]|nr:hypothetical protein [Planctomycetota bacterium]
MAKTKLLLTGFEPFAKVRRNPSWEGLAAIPVLPEGVERLCLPVDWRAADDAIRNALDEFKPDAVISFGVHSGGESGGRGYQTFYPETQAFNVDAASIADNGGDLRKGVLIDPDLPHTHARQGNGIAELDAALRAAGHESEISQDAGRYLCNHAYYRVLEARDSGESPIKMAAFVHVPPNRDMHPQGLADDAYPLAYQTLIDTYLGLLGAPSGGVLR